MRILLFFLSTTLTIFAQKQGNIWYFGNKAGITFNGSSPTALLDSQLSPAANGTEGSSAISDSSGALLFYSDGMIIWNKAHQVMQNGTGLLGNYSSTQSSIIVPDPAKPNRYFYIFTVSSGMCCGSSMTDGLRYSKIDMCLDSSRGGVIAGVKNIKILDTVAEKIAVCKHANGTDYWVVTHKFFSNKIVAFQLTSAGITNTVITAIGSIHGNNLLQSQGQMKISPNGQRIAFGSSNSANILDVFDFNISTGIVSNWKPLTKPNSDNVSVYGVEFSPDNSKLYASGVTSLGTLVPVLFQYDLTAGGGNINAINSSLSIISSVGNLLSGVGLQLGPDNKIYRCSISSNGNNLAVINNPNAAGTACNFQDLAVSLNGRSAIWTLPSFIAGYNYSNGLISCCSIPNLTVTASKTLICVGEPVLLTATGASNYSWSSGINGSQAYVGPQVSSIYTVTGANGTDCVASATVAVNVNTCLSLTKTSKNISNLKVFPNPNGGKFSIEIFEETHVLIFNPLGQLIFETTLQSGSHTIDISNNQSGIYLLTATNSRGQFASKIAVE